MRKRPVFGDKRWLRLNKWVGPAFDDAAPGLNGELRSLRIQHCLDEPLLTRLKQSEALFDLTDPPTSVTPSTQPGSGAFCHVAPSCFALILRGLSCEVSLYRPMPRGVH